MTILEGDYSRIDRGDNESILSLLEPYYTSLILLSRMDHASCRQKHFSTFNFHESRLTVVRLRVKEAAALLRGPLELHHC
jgi:hypothetical protein